ncbi:MAG: HD domain-containing protein [Planctomycetota bacterium]|nr:HD domain-containing protein [Planctomycetota bacterium]MDA1113182.1 HD domain-containing protein [Planctomycetota bacterium]
MKAIYTLSVEELEKRLLDQVGSTWPPIDKAVAMAKSAHDGQVRKGSGEPYVAHSLRTALWLLEVAEQKHNPAVICAGLLHDVAEDTEVTANDVEDSIGSKVGDLVRALTHPDLKEGESEYARNMRHLEGLRWEGRDAHIVKSADRLDNILTMEGAFTAERREEYLKETEDGVLPLTLASNTALYHALKDALADAKSAS